MKLLGVLVVARVCCIAKVAPSSHQLFVASESTKFKPEAVAHEQSKGTTKDLRVYKFRRLHGGCVCNSYNTSMRFVSDL